MLKQVAIKKKNGSCVSVLVCKNVDDREYNELLNEENENKQKELEEKAQLYNEIKELKHEIELLKGEIKFLKGEDSDEESN